MSAAGALEAFNPNAGAAVLGVAGQADGKLLVAGAFSTMGAATRNRVARLLADGTVDGTFNPNVTGGDTQGLAVQSDGMVLVGGTFTTVGGTGRNLFARLQNDAATQSLTVPTSARVQWLRGGAAPEAARVSFEVSTDAGTTYTPHGEGTRIAGGWEYVGALPVSGQLRARAFCASGTSNGSTGVVGVETVFSGFSVPDIVVEQPAGTNIADGGAVVFGVVAPGSTADREFTIRNDGTLDLTGLGITFAGIDPERFSVITPPVAPVAPGGSTTFTVRFAPQNSGGHTATMRIASNDFDENPFDVLLSDSSALSANANLTNLTLNTGPVSPAFSAGTTSYTAGVAFATTGLTVTPVKLHPSATIQVNGVTVASGSASAVIPLSVGANVINTVVTAADGTTTKTYTVTVTRAGAAAGDLDLAFDPRMNSQVNSVVPQEDGKILVAGYFGGFQPNGGAFVSRAYLARMNADGTSDATFNTNAGFINSVIWSVAPQADGKILVGGDFTTAGGVTRNRIARFNANGTLDASFNVSVDGTVRVILPQPDGKILIGGVFQNVQGTGSTLNTARSRVARLNADGTLDAAFDPSPNNEVYCMLLRPDGKIYVGGAFNNLRPNGAVSATTRNFIARLNADGTLDTAFNANASSHILSMAPQVDGKIVVGGYFGSIGGQSRLRMARLDEAGLADGFNPSPNDVPWAIAPQTDGKVLIGGSFTSLQPNGAASPTTRNRMARVNADGTLDTAFDPNFQNVVFSIALQGDGQILAGGSFSSVSQVSRSNLVRLGNDAVSQSLTVPHAGRIEWLRGGAFPEAAVVTFDASTDGGSTYTRLGDGTRIPGGWEFLPAAGTLPASGTIRALARSSVGGSNAASSSLTQATAAFSGFAVPDIVVEQPAGANIADGGAVVFGVVASGSTADREFTIRNTGTVDLTGLGISFDGIDPERFSVITPPVAPVAPGGSTTFTVRFAPQNSGGHTATMRIASNDFDETPFDIALSDSSALSANPSLVSLQPNTGILTPAFSPTTTSYALNVLYGTTGITLTPVKLHPSATIQVNGVTVASGSASAVIPLNVGANLINTVVTAADGVTTRTYAVTVTRAGPVVGDVDLAFDPNVTSGSSVRSVAMQADGKMLVGGSFSAFQPNGAVSATSRNHFARLNADGTLDTPNLNINSSIYSIVIQPDGKVLIAGDFSQVLGVARNRIARLNADLTLDTGFNPNANSRVWVAAVQPDGKILLGGSFTTLQPPGHAAPVVRNRIARLHADGSLDTSFDPNANSEVYCFLPQADGKMLVGGAFSTFQPNGALSSTGRNCIARLNADGTVDTAFNASANSSILCMTPQADGKVIVGGVFSSIGGQNRGRIARLNATGAVDSFNPNANSDVYSLVAQADGKVLISGNFTTLQPNGAASPTTRNRIARVNADGTLDSVFDPNANAIVRGVTLQADGQILTFGDFTTMGAASRNRIARLGNDAATQNLTVPDASRVQWLIGGASPEARATLFEVSTDGGASYQPFGSGTRIAGGWECLGSLPAAGQVRARAFNMGGHYAASTGITEAVISFSGFLPPDIVVEQPAGTNIPDGGGVAFGPVAQGASADRTFTVRNTGGTNLTGLDISVDGVDASMFSIITPPVAPVVPGGSSTFTVRFAPTSPGGHTAALHLISNDFDESPFDISLSDTGAASSNADLASLTPSLGFLSPAFASATTSYTVQAPYASTSLSLTPIRLQSAATIQVNGVPVASGAASAAIPLGIGSNVINIVVTAADGVTTKTYTVTVIRAAAGAGDVDLSYDPRASSTPNIYTSVPQPDGKILIGGYFFSLQPNGAASSTSRNYLARVNADGTLDTAFSPSLNWLVYAIALQPDGKILIGGDFVNVNGQARNRIARLNADGSLDTSFNPNANGTVYGILVQPDGQIVISGSFSTLQPNGAASPTTRNRIARLNADGTLDATFNPNANSEVYALALQPDGKILLGGWFSTLQPIGAVSAIPSNRLARLNADGTLDTAFNPNVNSGVTTMAVQPDQKILISGFFSGVNSTTRNRVARVNLDGTLDTTFNPNANGDVYSMALQADGKVVLGGNFTTLQPNGAASPTPRNRIARLNADGTLDTAFNPDANAIVRSLALQVDGQILASGDFSTMGAASRIGIARLQNDTATQLLTVPSATRVEWLRGGSLPEASEVGFEVSIDGGTNYSFLGAGTRISGGWEYLPALGALPANGQIRALARSSGGYYNGSGYTTQAIALFPSPFPEISVEHPAGTDLVSGSSTINYGSLEMGGAGLTKTFTINNTGAGNLGISSVFVTGGDAADFTVSTFGMLSVLPSTSGTTTFTVNARPGALTTRSTTLRIISNDTNESVFDIALTVTGIASTNADLASLSLSSGTLSPAFASGTTSYSATVPNAVSSLTVTPVKSEANAVIRVNGSIVASGTASGSIALSLGANVITTLVTAQDGTTTRTYTTTVTRTAAPLISSPTSSAVAGSSATLGGNVTSDGGAAITARGVVVSLTSTNSDPTLGGAGVTNFPSGGTTGVFTVGVTGLSPGLNYSYKAYATNSDGTSYTSAGTFTTVTSNADLTSLALSAGSLAPAFASNTTSYSAAVPFGTPSITVTPVKADSGASIQVRINGGSYAAVTSGTASAALTLNPVTNTLDILVTAQDTITTKLYSVVITFLSPAPTVTQVSPASGGTAGGTNVTITGTDFTGATSVTFGGSSATSVSVVNATTITCTTPAHVAGPVSVLVTTPGGTNAANSLYTYNANAAPTDITLTPASIAENNTPNATVGVLDAVDADLSDTHTFTLVAGTGDTDNASFTIDGTALKLTPVADHGTQSSYSVRVQANDGNGGIFAKALTITITPASFVERDVALAWSNSYAGPEVTPGNGVARAVAVQKSGNEPVAVYATGFTTSAGGGRDVYTVKHHPVTGALLWEALWDGAAGAADEGAALVVDAAGDVIVTGHTTGAGGDTDVLVVKYDGADGTVLWQHVYAGAGMGADAGASVAVDAAGGVAVAGHGVNASGSMDWFVARYAGDGTPLFEQLVDGGGGGTDQARAVGVDASGHVTAAGYRRAAAGKDFLLRSFDGSTGATRWQWLVNGATSTDDEAFALAVEAGGGVVATGTVRGSTYDLYTVRLDGAGALQWERLWDSPFGSSDAGHDVVLDSQGDVIVAGTSYRAAGVQDGHAVKYDGATGAQVWSRRFDGAAGLQDLLRAVDVDAEDNAVVTGYSQQNGGGHDILTAKLAAADGSLVWERLHDGTAGLDDESFAVGVSGDGHVYVAGQSGRAGGSTDFLVLGYVPVVPAVQMPQVITFAPPGTQGAGVPLQLSATADSGLEVSFQVLSGPAVLGEADRARLEFTGTGTVVVRATQRGNYQFAAAVPVDRSFAVVRSEQTIDFSLPASVASFTQTVVLGAAASSGLPVSYGVVSGPGVISGNELSFSGSGIVTISANQAGDARHNAAPEVQRSIDASNTPPVIIPAGIVLGWQQPHTGAGPGEGRAVALQLSGNDAVAAFVAGHSTPAGNRDIHLMKFHNDGSPAWAAPVLVNGPGNGHDEAAAVAVDAAGDAYICGQLGIATGNTDIYVAKFSGVDGTLLWSHTFGGSAGGPDAGTSLALGGGSVIIGGHAANSGTGSDFFAARLQQSDGAILWSRSHNSAGSATDQAAAVAIGGNGDIALGGISANDAWTLLLTGATGDVAWQRRHNAASKADAVRAVAIDANNDILITAYSQAANYDIHTAKYSRLDGSTLWAHTYNSSFNSSDAPWVLALDSRGDVLIAGTSYTAASVADSITLKYDGGSGALLWQRRYNGPAGKADEHHALALDGNNNPVITGYSLNADNTSDVYTAKLAAATGVPVWEERHNGPAGKNDAGRALAVTPAGSAFVAGYHSSAASIRGVLLLKYQPAGGPPPPAPPGGEAAAAQEDNTAAPPPPALTQMQLHVEQGEPARLEADYFDAQGNHTVELTALLDGTPAGTLSADPFSGRLHWQHDTSSTAPGTHEVLITATDTAGASASLALTLEVTPTPHAGRAWRWQHFGTTAPAGDAADEADPDGDGLNNLGELAFGLDPRRGSGKDALARLQSSAEGSGGSGIQAVYRRRKDHAALGLRYQVQFSSNLKDWFPGPQEGEVISDDGHIQELATPFPQLPDGTPATFFRIQVQPAP
ncbi:MAG: cadherin-like beta sandwich domain-containing protein [Verrucomicrobiaceae bacterium]|nr:cadherin-like beta sandwich domain-containing protein [Verrucomicrobiaceae bacterium]